MSHGQNAQEGVSGSAQKKQRADQTAEDARRHQRDHYAPRNIQPLSIRSAAGRHAAPERNRLRGIGGNRRHAGKQQRGKGDKPAAASDSIERAAHHAGDEQHHNGMQVQISDVSHRAHACRGAATDRCLVTNCQLFDGGPSDGREDS